MATFDWLSPDLYDDFKLFCETVDSWFCLQLIPAEAHDEGIHIEYGLNFLGTTSLKKFNQWKPTGAIEQENCNFLS